MDEILLNSIKSKDKYKQKSIIEFVQTSNDIQIKDSRPLDNKEDNTKTKKPKKELAPEKRCTQITHKNQQCQKEKSVNHKYCGFHLTIARKEGLKQTNIVMQEKIALEKIREKGSIENSIIPDNTIDHRQVLILFRENNANDLNVGKRFRLNMFSIYFTKIFHQ